ncbi:alpha/beta fold hydrolase [Longimicrobium terrae]|uniref:Pimeloyl-ACP methyl ester carboxylesterase n=1 Tax=Longimicrobium terrae TaxID=1639882 RepID=A0A841GLE0_9BACT|nr:alpha/beta fold hydrolase [Longimicrobium terrae]MBB4635177.1 pimeloyl-ACP methyl ester carboxylesterase [Longimicrobium terrae]MBB6069571.1 pimeloyl-ACP methyl ester carboxylesterase [Longimicrobium terrae]NNC31626.1 alpha/beta fold hydrolase [Longimicrobium terrae]
MPLAHLFGDATLSLLAARTPKPVLTWPLAPVDTSAVRRVEPIVVPANGLQITCETFGDPAHPPILLIMGLAAQMVQWDDEFCARLAVRGWFVIRYDNRDIGRSTWMTGAPVPRVVALVAAKRRGLPVGVPYLLDDMARDALGVLDALGIASAHVVGVSMGGMIAQSVAVLAPGRVRSLTSVMSHTGEDDLPHPHWRASAALFLPAPRGRDAVVRRAITMWRILNGHRIAVDLARTRTQVLKAYERGRNPSGVARQLAAILASPSRADALRELRIPTLVIHGDEDPLVPLQGGRRTAELIPGARLEIIPAMGHALPPPLWDTLINHITTHARNADG